MTEVQLSFSTTSDCTKTAVIFDDRMSLHECSWDELHIENPKRYIVPLAKCREYGLIDRCLVLPSRSATEEEIQLVHQKSYIKTMKDTESLENPREFEKAASWYDSVLLNSKSYEAALLASGCTIQLVESVLNGLARNGMAIVRPPGHHAMAKDACGFCLFNNVAIAAKYALEKMNLERILIVDWDVHHGQATQQTFYDDPRVLYFSIHRYENGNFWPHLRESNFDHTGGKSAQGFNINIPLNGTAQGNADYMAIFNNVLLPVAYEFRPQLVLVSAGYDAALGCPEGEMKITPHAYPHFINALSSLANGKVCVVLEGGYFISSLAESVALTLRGLLGDPCPVIQPCSLVSDISASSILNSMSVLYPFWNMMKVNEIFDLTTSSEANCHLVSITYAGNPLEGLAIFPTRDYYPIVLPAIKSQYESELSELIAKTDLSVPAHRTCFMAHMKWLENLVFEGDNSLLRNSGLLKNCLLLKTADVLRSADSNAIFAETLETRLLENEIVMNVIETELNSNNNDQNITTAINNTKFLLQVIETIVSRQSMNGMALCEAVELKENSHDSIFDPIALTTKHIISQKKKVLIMDLRAGFSDHMQNVLGENGTALYISINSCKDNVSCLKKGFNVNFPFNNSATYGDYLAAFFHVVLPIAYEFCPDIVLIPVSSAKSVAGSLATLPCYSIMIKMLSGLANGKVVVAINDDSQLAVHCLASLLNQHFGELEPVTLSSGGIEAIRKTANNQKQFWNCLKFDMKLPNIETVPIPDLFTHFRPASLYQCLKRRQSSDPIQIPNKEAMSEKFESFQEEFSGIVIPLSHCPHLEFMQPVPEDGLDPFAPCQLCNDKSENWLCLHCYQVYCGRFVNQHMVQHGRDMNHHLTLSFSDLSVWCYACDAYIHNDTVLPIKELAHDIKFRIVASSKRRQSSDPMDIPAPQMKQLEMMDCDLSSPNAGGFCVTPLENCPHVELLQPVPKEGFNTSSPCHVCHDTRENWVCLHCYQVYCGRFVNQHMLEHGFNLKHPLTLSYSDLSVWCYVCDSYVHNERVASIKQHAHDRKFAN